MALIYNLTHIHLDVRASCRARGASTRRAAAPSRPDHWCRGTGPGSAELHGEHRNRAAVEAFHREADRLAGLVLHDARYSDFAAVVAGIFAVLGALTLLNIGNVL